MQGRPVTKGILAGRNSSADSLMNGGVHHGGTTCGWRLSSRSSCRPYLRSRILENRSRGLCASLDRLAPLPAPVTAMSLYIGLVLMRSVVSSAVCSSCCCTGSKFASTSTAAPAVVRNAPVMVCAARRTRRRQSPGPAAQS